MRKTRVRNGEHQALFGGYARWTGRKLGANGCPVIHEREVRVWLRSDLVEDGCGADTEELCAALEAKIGPKLGLYISSCWRY